jgi:hypothetical protein
VGKSTVDVAEGEGRRRLGGREERWVVISSSRSATVSRGRDVLSWELVGRRVLIERRSWRSLRGYVRGRWRGEEGELYFIFSIK